MWFEQVVFWALAVVAIAAAVGVVLVRDLFPGRAAAGDGFRRRGRLSTC